MIWRSVLGFACLIGLTGCGAATLVSDAGPTSDAASASDRASPSDGGADRDAGSVPVLSGCSAISEGALAGCRSSDDPNCGRCCLQTLPDTCTQWGGPCHMLVAGQPVGDYCDISSLPGQCPSACPPCAACSQISEARLCNLKPTIGACDCANVVIGEDPCIQPDGCACSCRTYKRSLDACPPPA